MVLGAAPAFAHVELSATPGLKPDFRPAGSDYVSRCVPGGPLRLAVDASQGERVSVGGRQERTGTFVTSLRRRAGEGVSIRVRSHGAVTEYHVRCLPQDFPGWTIERHGKPQAQWYVTAPVKKPGDGYVAVFASNGAPVWWRRPSSSAFMPWDAKLLGNGLLAWGTNFGTDFGVRTDDAYEERTFDGRLVRVVRAQGSPTDVHDLQRMPNGDLLAITYRRRDNVDLSAYGGPPGARVFDGEIQELAPSGKVVWRWNSRTHVAPSETGREWWYNDQGKQPPPAERGYDLLHVNSVEPDGNGVVVSARHLNAVFRIDRASGNIAWKLGGTFVPGESLTVLGTPSDESVFGGQHDARLLKDGTLTVFDNRARTGGAPAAERFRIDARARTATLLEHVTDPAVPAAHWGGSAQKLPGGNWVVCWGGTSLITEQTSAGAVVLSLRFTTNHFSYRAEALAPGQASAADLRRGMDQMAKAQPRGD
jgi:hypothetical protein